MQRHLDRVEKHNTPGATRASFYPTTRDTRRRRRDGDANHNRAQNASQTKAKQNDICFLLLSKDTTHTRRRADLGCVRGLSLSHDTCTVTQRVRHTAVGAQSYIMLAWFNISSPCSKFRPLLEPSLLHTPLPRSVFASRECTLHLSTTFFVECQMCRRHAHIDQSFSDSDRQTHSTVEVAVACSSHVSRCRIRLAAETSCSATPSPGR